MKTSLLILLMLCAPAYGGSLVLHMGSTHLGVAGFNEWNHGIGFRTSGRISYTGGILRNSVDKQTVYFGAGKEWRVNPYISFALYAGVIDYPSPYVRTHLYLALVPIISIGKGQVKLDVIPIPIKTDTIDPAVLFSLNITLD